MSGHEFEKQVRQKLDDLKLTPTAQVWENIEEGLRQRRRRPAVIYWMPLLAISLTVGGYFIFNDVRKNDSKNFTLVDKKTVSNKDASRDVLNKTIPAEENSLKQASTQQPNISRVVSPDVSGEELNHKKVDAPGGILTDGSVTALPVASGGELAFDNKNIYPTTVSLSPAKQSLISPAENKFPLRQAFANEAQPLKKIKSTSSKWSYGLSASGGISAVNEGKLIAFNNARVEDVSTVAPFAPQQPYTPSSISPGITYSLGAFVQRELTNKWSLSLGLSYLQLNTHNKVGNQINSRAIVNNGNRGFFFVQSYFTIDQDDKTEYRNRYHFVELPVELHVNINNSKKFPMFINTGMSVSRLIRSNSLHFDGTTGVYYRNDKLINRTQVATSAGFAVGLLNRTTRPIQVGPAVRYNVTKILQKDVSARTSFMSFGIDARMFIK